MAIFVWTPVWKGLAFFLYSSWWVAMATTASSGKTICSVDSDCEVLEPYCYHGDCIVCEKMDEIWDPDLKKCREDCDGFYEHWNGVNCESMGLIAASTVGVPILLIVSICICSCCVGHAFRERRNKKSQEYPQTVFVPRQNYGYRYPGQYGVATHNYVPSAHAQGFAYPPVHPPLYQETKAYQQQQEKY